jgi:Integrase core domain
LIHGRKISCCRFLFGFRIDLLKDLQGIRRFVFKSSRRVRSTPATLPLARLRLSCALNDIDHRLTKPRHPWTNGQVERMNPTLKDATVKRYFYEIHDQLRAHVRAFIDAYNFARRLKTPKGLTSYEFICKAWTSHSQRFKISPLQQCAGLYI